MSSNANTVSGNATLKTYSWADYGVPGIVPMVWAYHPYCHAEEIGGRPAGRGYHDPRPALPEAQRVARLLRRRRPGERVLFIFRGGKTNRGLFSAAPAESIIHGPNVESTRRWMREFFAVLRNEGVADLDYFVLDFEDGVSFWIDGEERQQMWADLQQADRQGLIELPDALRTVGPEQAKVYGAVDRELPVKFAAFVGNLKADAVRDAMMKPMLEFFPGTPCSNYGDTLRSVELVDLNGWPMPVRNDPALLSGSHSSPVCYLGIGNRYRRLDPDAASQLAWADRRRQVQAALACAAPVAPWYTSPSFGLNRPGLWREALIADVQAGVRTLLLFGEDKDWDAEERQGLAELMPQLRSMVDA
ncbi:MAG: hypothetical protein AAGK78_03225 [Planctomycetota bacterium]